MAMLQQMHELVRFSSDREEDLIERVNRGDQTAVEELFNEYYGGLCRFTARLINSTEDVSRRDTFVEDLVQDIFVRIWTMKKGWHPHGSIKTYLFKAAHNQALNFIKNKRIKSTVLVEAIDEFALSPYIDPIDEVVNNDMSVIVNRSIEKLPKKCRLVFTLNREDGLSYSEIAKVLGISVKTVENQIARSLKYLRRELADLVERR